MNSEHPLRSYRKSKDLTQEQLASLLGVSYATINHIENLRRRITPERALCWEKKLGLPKEQLCPEVFAQTDSGVESSESD